MDDRSRALTLHRQRLLALEPWQRVREILGAPRPADMARALPAQEFYLTVVEAGLDQSLPLLSLAATHQLEFIFDVDCWSNDTFDAARAARWIATLHESDSELIARWLREADENLVVLTLLRLLRVYKADESTDQAFWPPDRQTSTMDGLYFVEAREDAGEEAFHALWEGLTRLRASERSVYEALLEQVLWATPAELEEDNHRGRTARLAEKGFPEFEEAMEVWAAGQEARPEARALIAQRVAAFAAPAPAPGDEDRALPVPLERAAMTALARAARRLPDERVERLLSDLVRLGNRFAVAGLGPLGDPETHREGLATAMSLVNLGLTELSAGRLDELGPRALAHLSVFELNRAGAGAVLQRAYQARALVERGWLSRVHLARARLDEALEGILSGLLLPRPMFTAQDQKRAFRDPEDLAAADDVLRVVTSLGDFLEHELGAGGEELPELTPLPMFRESPRDVDWSAVALTTLARAALGEPARPKPLDPDSARRALLVLLTANTPRSASQRFTELAASSKLSPAARFLAQVLESDTAVLPCEQRPDPRLVTALLFHAAH